MTDKNETELNDTTALDQTEETAGSPSLSAAKWIGAGVVCAAAVLYTKDKVQGLRARRAAKKAAVTEPNPLDVQS